MTDKIVVRKDETIKVVKEPTTTVIQRQETAIKTVYYGRQVVQYLAGLAKVFSFSITDWVLTGGQYILTIQHMMESLDAYIGRAINNSGNDVEFQRVENYNANTIKIYMPATDDLRFSGKVIIQKV
jgi:hypothetical protein